MNANCTSRANESGRSRTYYGPSPSDITTVSGYCMWCVRVPTGRPLPDLSDAAALLLGRALILQSQHGGYLPMDDVWMGGALGWRDGLDGEDSLAYYRAFDELTDAGLVWRKSG